VQIFSSAPCSVFVVPLPFLLTVLFPWSLSRDKACCVIRRQPCHVTVPTVPLAQSRVYDLRKRTQPASHLASSKLHASYHPAADVFSYFRYVSNISSYNITLCYTGLLQQCNKSSLFLLNATGASAAEPISRIWEEPGPPTFLIENLRGLFRSIQDSSTILPRNRLQQISSHPSSLCFAVNCVGR
jgi:hypothetical protein